MSYERFYPNGWQSGEAGGTPIIPEALNHMEEGILNSAPAVESAEYPGCYYRTVDGIVEWLNPPMVLGVEYRTTERYNGKAEYTKQINFGALPNTTSKTVYLGISASAMVDVCVSANNGTEWIKDLSNYSGKVLLYSQNLNITTVNDKSSWTASVTIKYTKD